MTSIKTAVVLAGGIGSRLCPVTLEIPKALIPIKGKALLWHVIEKVKQAGVETIFISLGHMSDSIIKYCSEQSFGVDIKYIVEKERLGTGGWLKLISDSDREKYFSDNFIVVNGDNLFDLDWDKMENFSGDICIALTKVNDVSAFGVADFDGKHIHKFVEKPSVHDAPSNLVNSGYYIFTPKVFDYVPSENRFMLERDVFPKVAESGKLSGYKDNSQWFDTGTFERWESVIKNWKRS